MHGRLEWAEVDATALAGNPLGDPARRSLLVYLPPGYDGATNRLPAVYFLHGFTGSARGWTNATPFQPSVPERAGRAGGRRFGTARDRRLRGRLEPAGRQPVDRQRRHRPLPDVPRSRRGVLRRRSLAYPPRRRVASGGGQELGRLRRAGDGGSPPRRLRARGEPLRRRRRSSTATSPTSHARRLRCRGPTPPPGWRRCCSVRA